MIRHLVLFTFRDDVSEEDENYILGQAEKLADIASVRRLEVGTLLDPTHEAYKQRMWSDFKHALLIDFDDEAGLDAYQTDSFHVGFAKAIRERTADIKVVDFVT
jgi:hypothetical protein